MTGILKCKIHGVLLIFSHFEHIKPLYRSSKISTSLNKWVIKVHLKSDINSHQVNQITYCIEQIKSSSHTNHIKIIYSLRVPLIKYLPHLDRFEDFPIQYTSVLRRE